MIEAGHLPTSELHVQLIVNWLQVNNGSGRVSSNNHSDNNKCLLMLDSTQNTSAAIL